MKRGLRKLCDVPGGDKALQRDVMERLVAQHVAFETYFFTRGAEDFIRFAVNNRDIPRAVAALPLTLRGFRYRAVGSGGNA